jgi:uncharacterized integral membrane protein (TIGR00698 family)
MKTTLSRPFGHHASARAPGIFLAGLLAAAAMLISQTRWAQSLGLSALTVSVVLGILSGNTFFAAVASRAASGVDFSRSTLLRAGIVLYGLRITFQQLTAVGLSGVVIDVLMLSATVALAVLLGTRVLKLDRQSALLIGAGSAICGAAAVVATEPVLRAPDQKVSIAVATVVVFGTLGMFLYPLAYPWLAMNEHAYGVYVGSTVHEVAHVVAAGRAVSAAAASAAVVEKMLRVMLLAPFLMVLSATQRQAPGASGVARRPGRITIPWFAVGFIAVSGVNSLQLLPAAWTAALTQLDTALLAMAMAALGLRTHVGAIRQAGARPLALAAALFLFLTVGGYAVNRGVAALVAHVAG